MSKKKFTGSISGKGYYIALILCATAIGISGYLYYRNANPNDASISKQPNDDVSNHGVQAVATTPGDSTTPTVEPTAPTPKTIKTVSPLSGDTISGYAVDCLAYNQTTRDWRTHDGIDIAANAGTEVCAAAAGTVYSVYDDDTMGKTVVIRHDGGYTTRYASLGENTLVSPGQAVSAGEAIGTVGQTALLETALGDHLHFSVSCNGTAVDPTDFLPAQ